MDERIKYLESLVPKDVDIDKKFFNKFSKYACYMGNGVYQYRDILSTNTRELFLMTSLKQLNEYTANVIKQTLETAAEKALLSINDILEKSNGQRYIVEEGNHYSETEIDVSKQSITDTFEETYQKMKV